MTQLRLTNSLGRHKQVFTPLNPDHVGMYVCGPTVYNYAHIGNARPAVVFDVLRRVLMHLYPHVTYVTNITDIDDKIMDAAKETGQSIDTITRKFEDIYNADMSALGVMRADVQPRATETVAEMIEITADLIAAGHAYEAEGHVLFSVPSYPEYGRLSGRNRDEQIAGARVDVAPYKRDPADFVLWKPSIAGQPGWPSPWGRGRPGWHIECSAMSKKYLGINFDIHGGGLDLTFPHHENEMAQSICAHAGSAYARYWVHNGFVTVEGEKMSKSIGNVLLVHDLLEKAPGEAIRFALLAAHYRQPFDWTDKGLEDARKTLLRFYDVIFRYPDQGDDTPDPAFIEALCDDVNTPQAIAVLHSLAKDKKGKSLKAAGALLGILQQPVSIMALLEGPRAALDTEKVEALIAARNAARAAKNFAESDRLRDELVALGVTIKDTPQGTTWSHP